MYEENMKHDIAQNLKSPLKQLFLKTWDRIQMISDQSTAFNVLFPCINDENMLHCIEFMTDQQIIQNFNIKCQQKNPQSIEKKTKDQQNNKSINFKNMTQENNRNFENQGESSKNIKSDVLIQNNENRIIKETQQNLKIYAQKKFTSMKSDLQEKWSFLNNYKIMPLLANNEFKHTVQALRKKQFSQSLQIQMSYINLVDSALFYTSQNHRLRMTQILALLIFLDGKSKQDKKLLQILTGEGKSTTISCLAAILAISGKNVDIVTTTTILAQRDVQEKTQFYNILDLKVDHNSKQDQHGPKKCYQSGRIVYGTPHTFQVDILFDEYKRRQTRNSRPYQVLIVDEVDSMFVDQKDHQTLLATTYPGFSEIIHPMRLIWEKINTFPILKQEEKFMLLIPSGNNTIKGPAKAIMQEIIKDVKKQFKNQVIPDWRMEFVELSLESWIQSAVRAAIQFKQNHHYLIQNHDIVPIDFQNTGALQEKVHWQNGLHQFLQIKHKLEVSTEGMTSNFISNLAHFDKYAHIYGLTGTLGSDESKKFLVETYKCQLMQIPPYSERKLVIDSGNVFYDEMQWATEIAQKTKNMIVCGRPVLIICETIHELNKINLAVKNQVGSICKIDCLKTGNQNIGYQLEQQRVIIATNLAGRGTDLKISNQIEKNGGMHVIISFMPSNSRVQMQARGRAARNGDEGSGELVINYRKYCQKIGLQPSTKMIFQFNEDINKVENLSVYLRDAIEQQNMKNDGQKVIKLRLKDRMFSIYCKGISKIPDFQTNVAKCLAIEEQWAMFLKRIEYLNLQIQENLITQAQTFTNKLVENHNSYYNPNHKIFQGINSIKSGNTAQALQHFQSLQNDSINAYCKIAGGLMAESSKIQLNPKEGGKIKDSFKKFEQMKQSIKQKKQMNVGIAANRFTEMNQQIFDHHKDLDNQQMNKFGHQLERKSTQIQIDGKKMNKMDKNFGKIGQKSKQKKTDFIDLAQNRILDGVSKHIEKIQNQIKNYNPQKQKISFSYKSFDKILKQITGDQTENKKALQKLKGEGFLYLPQATKQKIQTSQFKRFSVFLLGIAQIVVGAILISSTAGLGGFGLSMIQEGIKDCYVSIFQPEQLDDLKKYFSDKALNYAIALATCGTKGVKQLSSACSRGFTVLKDKPLKKILSIAVGQFKEGINMLPKQFIKNSTKLLSQGIAKKKMNIDDNQSLNPSTFIQKNAPQLKKIVNQGFNEQCAKQLRVDDIVDTFKQKTQKLVHIISKQVFESAMKEIKKLSISQDHIQFLISKAFEQLPSFSLNNQNKSTSLKMLKFMSQNIEDQNLGQKFIKQFQVAEYIEKAVKNIKNVKQFDKVIEVTLAKQLKQCVQNFVQQSQEKIIKQKNRLQNEINTFQKNQNEMKVSQHNETVKRLQSDKEIHNKNVQELNQTIEYIQKNSQKFVKMIKQSKCIDNGKIIIQRLSKQIPINLRNKLGTINFNDSSKSVEHAFQTQIYNDCINLGLRCLNDVLHQSKGITANIAKFANKLNNY